MEDSLFPQRLVCLTEETVETLYMMGEDGRIVGVSGYVVRPKRARKEKPRVSAFTSAKINKILELEPDLVLLFSDIQADIAASLVKAGVNVHVFNHRGVKGIYAMIAQLGGLIGTPEKAQKLIGELQAGVDAVRAEVEAAQVDGAAAPRVYFEEWDDPMISGIRWVSELVEICGGREIFPERAAGALASARIIADPTEVINAAPDIIIGSWCGKKFRPESVAARDGWQNIPAVRDNHLYEIKAPLILQPGPAVLTDGLKEIRAIIAGWQKARAA